MKHRYPFIAGPIVTLGLCSTFMFVPTIGNGQARLVLNNGGVVRIDNGAWVVVENGAPNAITTLPNLATGGVIRSEGEFNRIRWNIRNNTGTYVLPYLSALGQRLPFTCQVTGAGDNGTNASLTFSTYNHQTGGAGWDNYVYRPSDVTHMNNWHTGVEPVPVSGNDQSMYVVDRFWMVDYGTVASTTAYAYTTLPQVTLSFTYDTGDDNQTGNLFTTTQLGAQRFNAPAGVWGDLAPGLGNSSVPGTVTNAVVPTGHFFRSWTLSSLENPLPVELVRFSSVCQSGLVTLTWVTASERNSDAFIIERSADNITFDEIGTVAAAGNTSSITHYSFVDREPLNIAYYRLKQFDRDGRVNMSPVSVTGCAGGGGTSIVNAWDDGTDLNVLVSAYGDQQHLVRLFDAGGKQVWSQSSVALPDGMSTVRIPKSEISVGIYMVRFDGPEGPMSRKVALH